MDKLLFEQHPSPMLIYEIQELKILNVNAAFVEKYGYSKQKINDEGITIKQIHPDADIPKLMDSIESLSLEGIHESGVHRHQSKDGEIFYVKITSQSIQYKKQNARLVVCADITQQKKSEIKYQRLFENANDSIFLLQDGLFVDCNKKAEKLYKADRNEIIGKLPSYFSPDKQPDGSCSVKESKKRIQAAWADGSNIFEWQHQDIEGNLIDVEVSLNKIELPDGEYVQAIVRDITENKKTEAELRKNEGLFRNLFLKSPAALVMVDSNNQIQVINESFENMFGYSLDEVQGKNIDELVVPEGESGHFPKVEDRSYIERDFQVEGKRLTKSGVSKHLIIAGMPVYIDDKPVAGLGMYLDITSRKNSERELEKSLEEKQVLLEEVHHRVKNNLAIVSGLLQMQTMHVDDERLTKYIQNSQLRIQSMAIVHEMLYQSNSLSKIEFKDYIINLANLISEMFSPKDKDITITVNADALKLNVNQAIPCALIISELITNAFEYAFEGRNTGEVQINLSKKKSYVRVEVKDNGIGLPENFEEMRKISLGLTLVENLCLQLETEIGIDSGEAGTSFFVEFEPTDKPGSSSSNRIQI